MLATILDPSKLVTRAKANPVASYERSSLRTPLSLNLLPSGRPATGYVTQSESAMVRAAHLMEEQQAQCHHRQDGYDLAHHTTNLLVLRVIRDSRGGHHPTYSRRRAILHRGKPTRHIGELRVDVPSAGRSAEIVSRITNGPHEPRQPVIRPCVPDARAPASGPGRDLPSAARTG